MRRSALKSAAVLADLATSPQGQRSRGLLPFYLIEGAAICSDLVIIVSISVLTGIIYHAASLGIAGPVETFLATGVLTCVVFSAVLAARGSYKPQNLVDFWKQARLATVIWLFVFFVLSTVAFTFKITETYSRGATLTFFAVGWVAIIIWRLLLSRYIANALAQGRFAERKILLLAERGLLNGTTIVADLRRCGYLPVRTFEFVSSAAAAESISSWLLRSIDQIVSVSRQEKIGGVFLLMPWDDRPAIEQLMEQLRILCVPVFLLPDANVAHFLGGRIVNIGTTWTAELKRAPLTRIEQALKRLFDLIVASGILLLLAPMMLLVATAIKLESLGPVFFMQTRNGFNGRPFRMCKFRTMSVLEDGPVIRQVTKNDPRVTRFGRLLRRTNIDELPQLFNVIAGDMSLVGPRPHAAAHNSEYEKTIAKYAYRYHVKPGLTGWAQINGLRGETQTLDLMAKRVEFDLWYINNWSPWLDFKILLRTWVLGLQPTAY
jgi:undecaprenyl-phosphate galactose phosphotransferase/putative colanic acid biosynthesis UDP-glucose lipid carrier transferase